MNIPVHLSVDVCLHLWSGAASSEVFICSASVSTAWQFSKVDEPVFTSPAV